MSLTREQIAAVEDIRTEEVDIPEWGGTVFVKAFSGVERDEYDEQMSKRKREDGTTELRNLRAYVAVACVVDENGDHLFTSQDIPMLSKKCHTALDRIWEKWAELSGITEQALEEAEKNSDDGQSADSGCSLPEPSPTPA